MIEPVSETVPPDLGSTAPAVVPQASARRDGHDAPGRDLAGPEASAPRASERDASPLGATPFRIAATAIGLFLAAAAAIFAVLFWQTTTLLSEQVAADLRAEARVILAEGRTGGLPALVEAVRLRSRGEGGRLYLLHDLRGGRLAGNLEAPPRELDGQPGGGAFHYAARGDGASRLAVAIGVDTEQGARLLVGRDLEDQRRQARRMQMSFMAGFGLLALASLGAALAISRRLLARIGAINATSRSIMAGDLSRRVPLAGGSDELDGLAANLNAMLERIELLMGSLREVSDNIAHDLKTPLNRLRNRAEAALREGADAARGGAAGDGGAGYRRALEGTIEQADDLIKTFNALLLIARLEAGALDENKAAVDLGALVRDVAELYEPIAEERGLALAVAAPDGISVLANRHLIGQAVANMIDNAIKYGSQPRPGRSAPEGPITVALMAGTKGPEIAVADRGPGIAAEDRDRALKRFVRLEASRTQPGTGLGLSLVAAVARLHGAAVRLEDNAPGLRIVIAFPSRSVVKS